MDLSTETSSYTNFNTKGIAIAIENCQSTDIFSRVQEKKYISVEDAANLASSGISIDDAMTLGIRSVSEAEAYELVGYRIKGLMFPYPDPNGGFFKTSNGEVYCRLRPTFSKEGMPKYLSPKDERCYPYFPVPLLESKIGASGIKIYYESTKQKIITEGEKKAIALALKGYISIGLPGIWCFRDKDSATDALLPELTQLPLKNSSILVLPDSDVKTNSLVKKAVLTLAELLADGYEAKVNLLVLPTQYNGKKLGVDDILVNDRLGLFDGYLDKCFVPALKIVGKSAKTAERVLNLEPGKEDALFTYSFGCALVMQALLLFRGGVFPYQFVGTHWRQLDKPEYEKLRVSYTDANDLRNCSTNYLHSFDAQVRIRLMVSNKAFCSYKIAFENGTVSFTRPDMLPVFQPIHNPDDFVVNFIPYQYKVVSAPPTRWLKFLDGFANREQELIHYIRCLMRLWVTPWDRHKENTLQILPFFKGEPGCGKGVFVALVKRLLGEQNCKPFRSLDDFEQEKALATFMDALLVYNADAPKYARSIKGLNDVVDNIEVSTRKLYKDPLQTPIGAWILLMGNHLLKTDSQNSGGLQRRLQPVELHSRVDVKDPHLIEKLEEELPKILHWVMTIPYRDAHTFVSQAKDLVPSLKSGEVSSFEELNPLIGFLQHYRDSLIENRTSTDEVKADLLYANYLEWCKTAGERLPLRRRTFEGELKNSLQIPHKRIGRNKHLCFSLPEFDNDYLQKLAKPNNAPLGDIDDVNLDEIHARLDSGEPSPEVIVETQPETKPLPNNWQQKIQEDLQADTTLPPNQENLEELLKGKCLEIFHPNNNPEFKNFDISDDIKVMEVGSEDSQNVELNFLTIEACQRFEYATKKLTFFQRKELPAKITLLHNFERVCIV